MFTHQLPSPRAVLLAFSLGAVIGACSIDTDDGDDDRGDDDDVCLQSCEDARIECAGACDDEDDSCFGACDLDFNGCSDDCN
jgi:hypothetical protein